MLLVSDSGIKTFGGNTTGIKSSSGVLFLTSRMTCAPCDTVHAYIFRQNLVLPLALSARVPLLQVQSASVGLSSLGTMCFQLPCGVPARSERRVLVVSRTADDHGKAFITGVGKELIPGLMDDVAVLCLARVARSMLPILCMVCKAWREVVRATSFPSLRKQVS